MRRILATAAALVALAACSDAATNPVAPKAPAKDLWTGDGNQSTWTIFTTQNPDSYLDATPGWEIATRFKVAVPGRVVAFRWFKAPGETGTHTARLWTDGGSQIASATFSNESGSGWQTVNFSGVHINANTYYRVSVNTNTMQAKTFGVLQGNPIVNGPVTADFSYYGQPTGAMPTSGSYSEFFADVTFQPDPAKPNLYVAQFLVNGGTNFQGQYIANIVVCNNGDLAAPASNTLFRHYFAPYSGGFYQIAQFSIATPALGKGQCVNLQPVINPQWGGSNQFYANVDYNGLTNGAIDEKNEGDNQAFTAWGT
jgi:hypothetical protein